MVYKLIAAKSGITGLTQDSYQYLMKSFVPVFYFALKFSELTLPLRFYYFIIFNIYH